VAADDAGAVEPSMGVGCDLDPERREQHAVDGFGCAERKRAPAEGQDLAQPGWFRHPGIGRDPVVERVVDQTTDEPIARFASLEGGQVAVEAEACDFVDRRTLWDWLVREVREIAVEQMGPGRRQQPGRGEMRSVRLGQHKIMRVGIVELVEFVTAGDHRQVPLQQVDEHLLARLEHRPHPRIRGLCLELDIAQHDQAFLVEA